MQLTFHFLLQACTRTKCRQEGDKLLKVQTIQHPQKSLKEQYNTYSSVRKTLISSMQRENRKNTMQ